MLMRYLYFPAEYINQWKPTKQAIAPFNTCFVRTKTSAGVLIKDFCFDLGHDMDAHLMCSSVCTDSGKECEENEALSE